jgi:hypothetical protein
VPAVAPMLLVPWIAGMLTAVIAAEVLASVDLTHAAHVLAVHAALPSRPARIYRRERDFAIDLATSKPARATT